MYNFYQDTDYTTFVANMNWQNCVRSGIRTHAHIRGPENSLMIHEKVTSLESGALDHSAILTYVKLCKIKIGFVFQSKRFYQQLWKTALTGLFIRLSWKAARSPKSRSRQAVWMSTNLAPGQITGAVAQVVERSLSMWEVRGSIPRSSIFCFFQMD